MYVVLKLIYIRLKCQSDTSLLLLLTTYLKLILKYHMTSYDVNRAKNTPPKRMSRIPPRVGEHLIASFKLENNILALSKIIQRSILGDVACIILT